MLKKKCAQLVQPESECPYMPAYGHPQNPYVLNHTIIEGECKQSCFKFFDPQIFLEQTIHQRWEEDIRNKD